MSIPPEPVTGLCILPRSRTMRATSAPMRAGSPPTASEICLKLAESMLRASTSMDELVVAQRQVGVEPVGALGEHAGGGDHAPQSIGVHGGPRLADLGPGDSG